MLGLLKIYSVNQCNLEQSFVGFVRDWFR